MCLTNIHLSIFDSSTKFKFHKILLLTFLLISVNYSFKAQNSVGGSVTSDQSICIGSLPSDLTLIGNVGTVLYWEKDEQTNFNNPTSINSTATILSGNEIGSLNNTTYIRAVVQNGSSPIAYSNFVTITVNTSPQGDGNTFGNNEWIGYVFTNSGLEPSSSLSDVFTLPYSGFILQNVSFDQNIGSGSLNSPTICGSFGNYFAVRYKMIKNFVPGYYILTAGADESFRLSINGGLTYIIDEWSNTSYSTVNEVVYLEGDVEMVLEYYEKVGTSRVTFDYEFCGNTSTPISAISGDNVICEGESTVLTAIGATLASGAVFQWGTGLIAGQNIISGANSNSLTVSPSTTTNYWVRILDAAPCSITSSDLQITVVVVTPPSLPSSITGNTNLCSNQSTTLTANGATGNIQWQSSINNIDFMDISGGTNVSLTVNNINTNTYYRVRVSSLGACSSLTSEATLVTVVTAPVSGNASGSSIVCSGTNSTTLSLTGHNGNIQWQQSLDNENFNNISGATSDIYIAVNLNASTYYRASVTNSFCSAAISNVLLVTVKSPTSSGVISGPPYLCTGVNSTTLTLDGSNGNIQWQSSSNGIDFTNILNATTTSLVINNHTELTYFRVFVTNSPCLSQTSSIFSLDINQSPDPGTTTGGATVCSGSNSNVLTVTGSTATIQWQSSTDNENFSSIVGANSSTYQAENLNTTTYFRVITNNGFCNSLPSNVSTVVVLTSPNGGTLSGGNSVCSAINSTTFNVSGHSGNIQWQSSTDNLNFQSIGGQTNTQLVASNVSQTTYYRVIATNGGCLPSTSNVGVINYSVSIPGTISGATTVCPNTNNTILTLNNFSGSVQWQSSVDNETFNNISGATGSTFNVININQTTFYRVLVTNGACSNAVSAPVVMNIGNGATAGTIAVTGGGVSLAAGLERRTIQLSGNIGTIQWQSSSDNVNFSNISGATSQTYVTEMLTSTTHFRVLVTSGSCSATSSSLTISICTPTGNPTAYVTGTTWRAYVFAPHSGGANPSDAFTSTYQGFYPQSEQFSQGGISATSATLCGSNNGGFTTSAYFNRNTAVRMRLRRTFAAGDYTFLVGASASYRFSTDGGATWLISNFNRATSNTFVSNTATITLAAGAYDLVLEFVQSSNAGFGNFTFRYCTGSSSFTAPTAIRGNVNMQVGTNTTLFAFGGTGANVFQWGTGSIVGENVIAGAIGQSLAVFPSATTTYWVRRYDAACDTYTSGITRTVTVNTSTPLTPNGNTTDYGNGVWIGYVYGMGSTAQAGSGANAFSGTYKYSGYLTTTSDQFSFAQSPGTVLAAGSLWNQTTHTTTSGYFDQLYSIRFKMNKNFTPGYYTFTISADDGMRFSVDGGSTWIINRWAWTSAGTTNTYSVFLSGSTNLVLEFNGGTGGQSLSFSYVACTNFSTAPTTILGSESVCTGQSIILTASGGVTGANGQFEWGTGNVVGSNVISGTSSSITVSPSTTTTYWVRRRDVGGNCQVSSGVNTNSTDNIRVTSDALTNGVTKTISIDALTVAGNISGGGLTVCENSNSTPLTLSGNVGNIIQWQSSADNVFFTNINGATGSTYQAENLTTTTFYRAVVTNGSCNSATSSSTNVVVNSASVAGTISGGSSVCEGINSNTLTVSGSNGSIQWQSSANNLDFANIAGEVSSNLIITNLSSTTYFRALVRSGICESVNTNAVVVTVTPVSVAGTITGGEGTVCATSNNSTLLLNGNQGTIQWQSSLDNNLFTNIPGASNNSLVLNDLQQTTYYRAIVTNGVCPSIITSSTGIFVDFQPIAGTLSGGTTVCSGSNNVNLSLAGSQGSIVWQSSVNNLDFTTIVGSTSSTLSVSNLTSTRFYRALISNGVCSNVTTNTVTINVSPNTVAGSISGAGTYCQGSPVNLSISGHVGTVQWNSSTDNAIFTPISGATSSSYLTSSLTTTTYFTVTVRSGVCNSLTTVVAPVIINPTSVSGNISGETSYCTTTNSTILSLAGSVGSIQWQSSINNIDFNNINGATSSSFNAINVDNTTYYRVVVTSGVCSSVSSLSVPIFVGENSIGGTIAASNQTICSGSQPANLTLGGYVGSIVKWQRSTSPSFNSVTDIANTSPVLSGSTIGNLTSATYFRAVVQLGDCASTFSSTGTVLVSANSVGGTVSSNQTICAGSTPNSLVLTGNTGAIIRWESSANSSFTSPNIINNTNNTLPNTTIGALNQTRFYRAVVQNSFCSPTNSSFVTITVNAPTVSGTISGNSSICEGASSSNLTVSGQTGTILRWQRSTDASFNSPIDIINPSSTLSSATIGSLIENTYFRVIVRNGVCSIENSAPHLVEVIQPSLATMSLNDGDFVWRGNANASLENQSWLISSNWYSMVGNELKVSNSLPNSNSNVFITNDGICFQENPNIFTQSTPACKNLTILPNGTLSMHTGSLNVSGNWTNNGTFHPGNGLVEFNGSGNHTIGGSSNQQIFNDLNVIKPGGQVKLLKHVKLNGDLNLISGLLDIDNYDLEIESGIIQGGNNNSYIVTSGLGFLKRNVGPSYNNTNDGFVRFPVGRSRFNPAQLQNVGSDDLFSVRVYDNVTDDSEEFSPTTSLPAVARTWLIEENLPGGSDLNMRLFWNRNQEEINNFDYSSAYIAHFDRGVSKWEMKGGNTVDGSDYIQTNNVTNFSPFAISSRWGLGYESPLPVELLNFTANCDQNYEIKLSWSTASEHNSLNFEIQKSLNGYDWISIDTVPAAGFSNSLLFYESNILERYHEENYFRLKQNDINGDFKIYPPLLINCIQSNALKILSIPNPSFDKFDILLETDFEGDQGIIKFHDSKGVLLHEILVDVGKGINLISINDLEVKPGIYYVFFESGDFKSNVIKHLKY